MIPPSAGHISSFWNWFSGVSTRLSLDLENADIVSELDRRVLGLNPGLSWEIGPYRSGGAQFVISPSSHKSLLPRTISVMEKAPKIPGWHFLPARPPKEWDFKFSLEDKNSEPIEIEGRDWTYVCLKYPDGLFDLILRCSPLPTDDEDTNWHAASLLVEGALGEIAMLTHINPVVAVESFQIEHEAKARSVLSLRDDFRNMLKSQSG